MTTPKYTRHLAAALSLTAVLAACTTDNKSSTVAQDSALNRDLSLARTDTGVKPQLRDVPAAAAPAPAAASRTTTSTTTTTRRVATSTGATSRSTRSPSTTASGNSVTRNDAGTATTSGGGAVGTIPSGTSIDLASNQRVCTNTAPGTAFTARTSSAISAGGVTIPAGATANVRVTDAKRSSNANDPIVITLAVTSLSWGGNTYPIASEVTYAQVDRVRDEPKSRDVEKVVGGAVVGAAIGQILGKNTQSTVIGAATGAAAGTAIAMGTANYQGCIPDGGRISIKLTSAASVKAE